jgi:hypothetical protein
VERQLEGRGGSAEGGRAGGGAEELGGRGLYVEYGAAHAVRVLQEVGQLLAAMPGGGRAMDEMSEQMDVLAAALRATATCALPSLCCTLLLHCKAIPGLPMHLLRDHCTPAWRMCCSRTCEEFL